MATPQDIAARLADRFPGRLLAIHPADKHPRVHIDTADWAALADWLRHDPDLSFDWLRCLSGIDYAAEGKLCVAYDLWSSTHRHDWCVKVFCDREAAVLPSVCHLWRTADWHEREAYDLFGIHFEGHPDLRRILMADDWEGYPLRKDYEFPRAYHGIPGSVELDWRQGK